MKRTITPIFFLLTLLFASLLQAQGQTIGGQVTADDGSPIPGVSVVVKGTTTGTITDANGTYSLSLPANASTLVFSFVGFTTVEEAINSRSTINVTMEADITQLSEVVVTEFGIEKSQRSLGYAVEKLDNQDITRTKQTNLVETIQGKVSGVQITNSGGAPGMSSRIIIRGITSLNPSADNQPLFVVDGVPIDNSTIEADGTPRGLTNRAADINPNDIAELTVLKGAAATALYGVRAANGAIVITTKKGQSGKARITAKSTFGIQEINKTPDLQSEFGQGFSGEYQPTSFWPSWGAPVEAVQAFEPDHRFYNNYENIMQTGMLSDNYLSISGGNDQATFFISSSYLDQQGVVPNSGWDRTSFKLSGTINASPKLKIAGSALYSNSGGNRVPFDRIFERLMYWSNTQDANEYVNPDGTQITYGNNNPVYDAYFNTYEDNVNRLIGNINLNYDVNDWMSLQYRLGTDFYSDDRTEIEAGPAGVPGENVFNGDEGAIEETRIRSRDLNSTLNLTLQKEFSNGFSGTLRLGNDVFDRQRSQVAARGDIFLVPRFYSLDNTIEQNNDQRTAERRLVGVYGDLTMSYNNLVYLTLTGRNDWTSTLPQGNNSFFYPSVSTSILFGELLNLPEQVTFAKFRASYAEVGKDTDPYLTSTTFDTSDPVNNQLGFSLDDTRGSQNLEPERTTSVELGLATAFFSNRISLDATWYRVNSRDQILVAPVSETTGFSNVIVNAGEIQNTGIELLLNATPAVSNGFRWDITTNFTRNRNEVIEISDLLGDEILVGSQFGYAGSSVSLRLVEGDPYGNLYGTSYERFYENGTPDNLTTLNRDLPIVIGANGFPVRNGEQLILGNAQPDWLMGITNSFSYKGLNLSFLIDIRQGIEQYSQFNNFFSAFGKLDYSTDRNSVVVFDGVQENGSPNDEQVWLGQGIGPDGENYGAGFYRNHFRGMSENFVRDASFVKLRNITLGYALPSTLLDNSPFTGVEFSVAANNIILFTPWNGYDPESFSAGASGNATAFTGLGHPGVRSLLFTLNVTL